MKLNFLKQKPNTDPRFVRKMLMRLPLEQRLMICDQMWNGTSMEKMPISMRPFKIMFEDANKQAIGRAWDKLIQETQEYIKKQVPNSDYEKHLLKIVYKNEADKLDFLHKFFKEKRDWKQFEDIILNDIIKSKEKQYQEHLNYWIGEN